VQTQTTKTEKTNARQVRKHTLFRMTRPPRRPRGAYSCCIELTANPPQIRPSTEQKQTRTAGKRLLNTPAPRSPAPKPSAYNRPWSDQQ
jgi:hypothetical protein